MLNIFKDNTIRKRVMDVIDARIKTSQDSYEVICKAIDEDEEKSHKQIERDAKDHKEKVSEKLVNEILGKVL